MVKHALSAILTVHHILDFTVHYTVGSYNCRVLYSSCFVFCGGRVIWRFFCSLLPQLQRVDAEIILEATKSLVSFLKRPEPLNTPRVPDHDPAGIFINQIFPYPYTPQNPCHQSVYANSPLKTYFGAKSYLWINQANQNVHYSLGQNARSKLQLLLVALYKIGTARAQFHGDLILKKLETLATV